MPVCETEITAQDITRAMRVLFPHPVRLSTRDISVTASEFLLKLPSSPANVFTGSDGWTRLGEFLGRRLGCPVTVLSDRNVRRHDCGRDVEFALRVGKVPEPAAASDPFAGLPGDGRDPESF